VTIHPLYEEAHLELIQAEYEVDIYEAATKTLEHSKSALKDLVFLWGASYFAGNMKTSNKMEDGSRERFSAASIKASATRKRKK
jgi:hypothetical protein